MSIWTIARKTPCNQNLVFYSKQFLVFFFVMRSALGEVFGIPGEITRVFDIFNSRYEDICFNENM